MNELIKLRDDRLKEITFSYSSASTFETCPYAYRLSYLEKKKRIGNFYAQYGSFIHDCMEKYFDETLEIWELLDYYNENFDRRVSLPSPWYVRGLKERYKQNGRDLFTYLDFDKSEYEILFVENRLKFDLTDTIKFVAVPDLVLKNKETGITTMFDYKSSSVFKTVKKTGKEYLDKQKLNGYWKQMYVYTYALRKHMNLSIDEISLWFVRFRQFVTVKWDKEEEEKHVGWLKETIDKIFQEEEFLPNNTDEFFCKNLCGVRMHCKYKKTGK